MAKRQSLTSFSPKPHPAADSAKVVSIAGEAAEPRKATKYPHVTVYLRPDEIRTLKLLTIETGEKISDICADAIREWMQRNGHARTGKLIRDV